METIQLPKPQRPPKQPRRDFTKLVSTRKGAALVAGASALLAAAILMVFLAQYRRSLDGSEGSVTVLVAKNLIEKGSSGTVLAENSIFQTARVKKSDLKDGAIADPANLRGKVAADDIYPGEQLVTTDFAPTTGGVREHITGDERGISIPLDSAHGMIGDVQAGDHVDVLYLSGATGQTAGAQGRSVLVTMLRDLQVLRAPKKAKGAMGGSATQSVVLRATDAQAAKLAFASDNGKIWLTLRAKVGARDTRARVVDQRGLLLSSIAANAPQQSR
jgi:Flp pilus assembly protein CpaB